MTVNTKKILQITGISIFFLLIIFYAFFRSQDLIFGIKIKNVNIVDGVKVTNAVMEIRGNAKHATNLTLNGREISINEAGDFNETFALLPGYNIVSIKAQDKFGYVDQKDYKLIY